MALIAELRDYRLALASPLVTAHGVVKQREGVLFSISDGVDVGWGEAAPLPGWSQESLTDSRRTLDSVAPRLAQLDSLGDLRLAAILAELEAQPHARAALAGAVFDLSSRRQGVSLAGFLRSRFSSASHASGSPLSRSVLLNGLISHGDPAKVGAAAAALVAEGVSAVKLKVAAAGPQTDVARVSAARSAIGDDIELRLDANGGWDVETAISTLREMAGCNVAFCEEPTSGIDGIAAVGAAGVVPVAVDESAATPDDIVAALKTNMIRVVIVKPQALGGSDLAMSAIALAEDFGATAVVTSMIDSAVGVAHAAHVAAASLPGQVHGLATSDMLNEDVGPRLGIESGKLILADLPGLGVAPSKC
ncbi:MAG: o-succinylbenzoate synthase [Acidimicrobiaceae bacterium]|nr:o-succinylbenzoate synthase [Acidimicrobiaceae bacterium]